MNGLITVAELHQLVQAGQPLTILDVRREDRWAEGHIAGALHIPYAELAQRLSEVPRDRPVVTY